MSFITHSEKQYQVIKDVHEVKMKVNINTNNCEDVSQNCADDCVVNRIHGFSVNLDGKKIFGDMCFHVAHDDEGTLDYGIILYDERCFSVDLYLNFKMNGDEEITEENYDRYSNVGRKLSEMTPTSLKYQDVSFMSYEDEVYFKTGGIDTDTTFLITGEITLKFDFITTVLPKKNPKVDNFKSLLCENAFENFDGKKDFTIVCQGNKFHFNKTLLSMISEVFEKMIQDSDSKEAQTNSVEINDFSPDTIEKFQKVAFESENAKNEDLTPDLLLFAQKYLIMPLVEKCKKHLINSMTCDNIFEIIKVAYLIDDDDMLKTASKFFSRNIDQLKSTEELKDFQKLNPMCMIKVFNYINGIEN